MVTMDDFLYSLYAQNKITGEIALERAQYPEELRVKMMASGVGGEEPVV
jgi:Tfp pilus assembly ATPase PilU